MTDKGTIHRMCVPDSLSFSPAKIDLYAKMFVPDRYDVFLSDPCPMMQNSIQASSIGAIWIESVPSLQQKE